MGVCWELFQKSPGNSSLRSAWGRGGEATVLQGQSSSTLVAGRPGAQLQPLGTLRMLDLATFFTFFLPATADALVLGSSLLGVHLLASALMAGRGSPR